MDRAWIHATAAISVTIAMVSLLASSAASLEAQPPDQASRIFDLASRSVLVLVIRSDSGEDIGSGTGFVVAGGSVITNEHVSRAGNVFINLGDAIVLARVARADAANDLALLTADVELAAKPLSIAAQVPETGTSVFVIGNPAGLERTISTGIVSGVREFTGRKLLQITAPISP